MHTDTQTHTYTLTRTHSHTHTYTHVHTRTHTHTHTHFVVKESQYTPGLKLHICIIRCPLVSVLLAVSLIM